MSEETTTPEVKLEDQMTPEELQAQTEAEDFVVGFKDEDYEDPDKVEKLKGAQKLLATTIHQKRHYRGKVEELSKPATPAKPEEKKPETPATPTTPGGETTNQVDPYKVVTFRQDHPELSRDVVKEIVEYAGSLKIDPEEALAKPLVQSMIKNAQTAEDVADASTAPEYRGTSGTEKRDWSTATPQEVEAQRNKIMYGG